MGIICGNKIRTRILLVLAVFALLFPVAIVADDVQHFTKLVEIAAPR